MEKFKSRLKDNLRKGYVDQAIKLLLIEKLDEIIKLYPDSWDRTFLSDIIHYNKKLTEKQIDQLERILGDRIFEEEHPGGINELLEEFAIEKEDTSNQCTLERGELLRKLKQLGFVSYKPRTSSWQEVLICSNDTSTLYFLIGKRNIDFKIYNHLRRPKIDDKGRLYTDGGDIVRNYYDSKTDIHQLTLLIASRFLENKPFEHNMLIEHGISSKTISEKIKSNEHMASHHEMIELYETVKINDGEDAYLSDGVFIKPDGTLYEK